MMNAWDEMKWQKQENLKDIALVEKQKEACKRIYKHEMKNKYVSGQLESDNPFKVNYQMNNF